MADIRKPADYKAEFVITIRTQRVVLQVQNDFSILPAHVYPCARQKTAYFLAILR